jgi:hypothetical protein
MADLTAEQPDVIELLNQSLERPEVLKRMAQFGFSTDEAHQASMLEDTAKAAEEGAVQAATSLDKSPNVVSGVSGGVDANKNNQPEFHSKTINKAMNFYNQQIGASEAEFRQQLVDFSSRQSKQENSIKDRIRQIEGKKTRIDFTPLLAMIEDPQRAKAAAQFIDRDVFTEDVKQNQLSILKEKLGQLQDTNSKFRNDFEAKNKRFLSDRRLKMAEQIIGAAGREDAQDFEERLLDKNLTAQEKRDLDNRRFELEKQARQLGVADDKIKLGYAKLQEEISRKQIDRLEKQNSDFGNHGLVKKAEETLKNSMTLVDQLRNENNWEEVTPGEWKLIDSVMRDVQFQRARLLNGPGVLTNQDFDKAGGNQSVASKADRLWETLLGGRSLNEEDLDNFVKGARSAAETARDIIRNKSKEFSNASISLGVDKVRATDFFEQSFKDKTSGAMDSINADIPHFSGEKFKAAVKASKDRRRAQEIEELASKSVSPARRVGRQVPALLKDFGDLLRGVSEGNVQVTDDILETLTPAQKLQLFEMIKSSNVGDTN